VENFVSWNWDVRGGMYRSRSQSRNSVNKTKYRGITMPNRPGLAQLNTYIPADLDKWLNAFCFFNRPQLKKRDCIIGLLMDLKNRVDRDNPELGRKIENYLKDR
jgi:hypothetical protein